jgi:hypothetical protein
MDIIYNGNKVLTNHPREVGDDLDLLVRGLKEKHPEYFVDLTAEALEVVYSTAEVNLEARQYLASTDWMATREAETGTAMPKDVKAARKKARAAVV